MVVKKEVVVKSFFLQREYWSGCAYIHCIGSSWFRAECVCQRIGVGLWTSGLYTVVVEKPLVISWSIDNLFRCGWKHSSRIFIMEVCCWTSISWAMNEGHAKCFDHVPWWMSHECTACKMFWPCIMMDEPWMQGMQNILTMRHAWNLQLPIIGKTAAEEGF